MSQNSYRGKEETDKIDFGKTDVEEQKRISKEHMHDNEEIPVNENIAEEANKKFDKERSKHLH